MGATALATFAGVPPDAGLTTPRAETEDVALFREVTRLPTRGVRFDWVANPLERRESS